MSLAHHSSLTPPLYLLKIGPLFWVRPPQPDIKVEIFQGENRDFFSSLKWFGIYCASPLSPIHSVLFENSSRMPSFFDNMFKFCMGYGSTNFRSYKKAKKKLLTCTLKVSDAACINAMKERQNTPDVG